MSFYSGSRNAFCPGPITGNPLNGLCEKACIHAKKVFDACLRQMQETDVQVTVTDYIPANPTQPLTFVSVNALPTQTTINNLVVERFEDKPCFARVSANAQVPITVNYTDANGVAGSGIAFIPVSNDVVLYVPQPSIVPYKVEAFGGAVCSNGTAGEGNTFTLDICLTLVLKIVVEADLLVPSYGYAHIPPCQEFSQDVCSGFFDLPLFPAQQPVANN